MSQVLFYLHLADDWLRGNLGAVALAQTATFLVIYGDFVNEVVRVGLKPYPFFLRLIAFVFLCAVGFGAFGVFLADIYEQFLAKLDYRALTPVVAIVFIVLGMAAERGVLSQR